MHALLSLTLMHDRSLSAAPNRKLTPSEAYHVYQSTSLFHRMISGHVLPAERDAIWASKLLLATVAFYHVEADTPQDAWPLRPSSPLDLNWLWLSDGKQEVFKLCQPLRADSVWQESARNYLRFLDDIPVVNVLDALPPGFIDLCNLDDVSTTLPNPYYAAALSLAQSLYLEDGVSVIMSFIAFTLNLTTSYKTLLKAKDAGALMLLAYWYAKVSQYQLWWIYGRASLELQAICIYLERYHWHEANIAELLIWPKLICSTLASGSK